MKRQAHMRGFTLLELMIASAIGVIIVSGVFVVMATQTTGNRNQAELIEAQQNARTAMNAIVADVSRAGFGIPGELTIGATSLNNFTGTDVYGTCPGTDVLSVSYRDARGFWLLQTATTTSMDVKPGVDPATILGAGYKDIAWPIGSTILVYPSFAKAFTVKTSTARPLATNNSTQSVGLTAATGFATPSNIVPQSDVHRVNTVTYRVICQNDAQGIEQRSLIASYDYDSDNSGAINNLDIDPVAADIEDLQVVFLYDADGDGMPEAAPSGPTVFPVTNLDRQQVKAVRVSLVARTARFMSPTNKTMVSAPFVIEDEPAWPTTPTAPPYGNLFRYSRRMLREVVLLGNRDTAQPTLFSYISNRWL